MLFQRDDIFSLKDSLDFDVKVLCGNFEIFTHRLVLASCSIWLKDILKISECDDTLQVISMDDFNLSDLRKVFDFIYGRIEEIEHLDIFNQLQFWDFRPIKKENIAAEAKEGPCNSKAPKDVPLLVTDVDENLKNESDEYYKDIKEPDIYSPAQEVDENEQCIDMKFEVKVEEATLETEDQHELLLSTVKKKPKRIKSDKSSQRKSKRCCVVCEYSKKRTGSLEDLTEHYLKEHQIIFLNGRFKCDICVRKFTTKQNLDIHMNVAHKGLKLKCDGCNYECKNKSNLEKHKQKVHQGITFPCEDCSYVGSTNNKLREHIRVKHEGYKYICDQCNHWTTDASSLKHHKNSKHDTRTFPCTKCKYIGNTLKDLRKHTKIMHEPKKFLCDQCDYAAAEMQTLTEHKMVNHEGFRLQCEFCDYSTKARSSLRDHRNVEHLGIKFLCDLCEYIGRNQSELKKHKAKRHEGLRFYCDVCDYSALAKATVKEHKKVKHEGLRFYCDECPCIFICKENLKKHKMKRHDVAEPILKPAIKTDIS